jgi:hypothetical protein
MGKAVAPGNACGFFQMFYTGETSYERGDTGMHQIEAVGSLR